MQQLLAVSEFLDLKWFCNCKRVGKLFISVSSDTGYWLLGMQCFLWSCWALGSCWTTGTGNFILDQCRVSQLWIHRHGNLDNLIIFNTEISFWPLFVICCILVSHPRPHAFKKMVFFAIIAIITIITIFDHYYKFCDVFEVIFERKTIRNVPKPKVLVKIRNFIPKLPVSLAFT